MTTELAAPLTRTRAEAMEEAFLGGLHDAQVHFEAIVAEQAWTALGFDTFADWWQDRVVPTMHALSMKPTRELASSVVEIVRREEAELPPTWRRTQAELASMVGTSEATVGRINGTRSSAASTDASSDLDDDSADAMVNKDVGEHDIPADIADAITTQIDEAARHRAGIEADHARMADNLRAIPAARVTELADQVRPAQQFVHLANACRQFLDAFARVDLTAAAAGFDPTKAAPLHGVLERATQLRQITEARA